MTLESCHTRTTVEPMESGSDDEVWVRDQDGDLHLAPEGFGMRVTEHLDRLRAWAGFDGAFRVATENSFPMGAGIASSASGFAALTLAVLASLERKVSTTEASILTRLSGSGSAARSVLGGFVEWPVGEGEGEAMQLAPAEHWDLRDVVVVVDSQEKAVSSREGHLRATTSPYFTARQQLLSGRLERVRRAIRDRDFTALATVVEEEAVDLHLVAMSSRPAIFYWQAATLRILDLSRRMSAEGARVCYTMDAGANVHLICTPGTEDSVVAELEGFSEVQRVIRDRVGTGPRQVESHVL
jgi:diphosphomevalonate decarboxylase